MVEILDYTAFALTLPALYLLGQKNRLCFMIFIVTNAFWVRVALEKNLIGLVGMNIVYFLFNIYNYRKWSRDEKESNNATHN